MTFSTMTRQTGLPQNVSEFQDRHGKWHLRYRAKGQPTHYFEAKPGTPEFRAELEACRERKAETTIAEKIERIPPGSLSALIALYYSKPAFTGLAASSQRTYRSTLERLRAKHGEKSVKGLTRDHIEAILGKMADRPAAANKLLDKFKILMALAVRSGWRRDDPTIGIKGYSKKTEGFHTWTEDEIAQYEAFYPIGSKARLALDLMLYTGQRRSDARTLGRQHLANGGRKIRVRQQKTDARLLIPVHAKLQASLDAAPLGEMSFLVSEHGKPFGAASIGNRMRKWCDAAALPQCSAHGLRKATARRLAEAGCSNQQIKAITGHTTDAEVARYTAAADQQRLAEQAMQSISEPEVPPETDERGTKVG
jgi:integrase